MTATIETNDRWTQNYNEQGQINFCEITKTKQTIETLTNRQTLWTVSNSSGAYLGPY